MHTHRSPLVALVTLTLATSGCAVETESPDSPTAPAFARVSITPVSISGVCETEFDAPTLPPPPVFEQVDRGTCFISHLGKAVLYSLQEIDVVNGTQTSIELTYTSTNGDVLRAVNAGTNVPEGAGVRFTATTTFIGGTGRFENATGEVQIEGAANFLPNTATYTLEGWIRYDASLRSGT